MNNDFKIYRDNIDAGVRGLHGQVREISIAADNGPSPAAMFASTPDAKSTKPAISDFSSRLGGIEEVLITQLPHGFGDPLKAQSPTASTTPTLKDISEKMGGIKPGLESDNGMFGRLKEMLFGKDKDNAPSLSR